MQIAIFIFMGAFGLGIAIAFFAILWKRPWVFYPPSEFSASSPRAFVNAMASGGPSITDVAAGGISNALSAKALLKKLDLADVPIEQRERRIERVVQEVREDAITYVSNAVLRLDARPLIGKHGPRWEEPFDETMPVGAFLDRVLLRLQPFPPHAYGTAWVLKNTASQTVYEDIGPNWAQRSRKGTFDDRSLAQVGIKGGMVLEVIGNR